MSGRRTRSGGAAQRSGPKASPPAQSGRRSQRKSGSDLPNTLPDIWPKAPHATPVRKPIVLKKIVAHAVKIPNVHSPRRSPRIAFFLEKENNPPIKEPTREDLFKTHSVPVTPTTTPVLYNPDVESNSREADLDTRDLEMSKKVRRSYSRLETFHCASTSTPGRPSCFGFEGLLGTEDLAGVSPLLCSKLTEVSRVPVNPWVPDTTLPGISPPVKEKRKKKKVPEILSPQGRQRAHSKPIEMPVVQPVEEQKLEDSHVSEELGARLPPSEQKLDLQPEPTVKFLFTLLSAVEPPEPKEPEEDLEIQESRFLDEEDWGIGRTSKEMSHLHNACIRLQESLSTMQADNLALGEKLQNLPSLLYKNLKKELKAAQQEPKPSRKQSCSCWTGSPVASDEGGDTSLPSLQQPSVQEAALLTL
uniref:Cell division cycle associated 5 n=1 Tax=Molossus molossus TaxID=27622 RepID=A0A7J8EP13_MOLMO|nr:cell division cycle associated 5 [Molossus molossus]